MYKLKEKAYLADTPGFSTFSIEEIHYRELEKYFVEFAKFRDNCEYLDCSHTKEQKCGIKQALASGDISQKRYENYIKLYEELKDREEHKW